MTCGGHVHAQGSSHQHILQQTNAQGRWRQKRPLGCRRHVGVALPSCARFSHLLVIIRLKKLLDGHKLTRLAVPALCNLPIGPLSDLQRHAYSRRWRLAHGWVVRVSRCNTLISRSLLTEGQAQQQWNNTPQYQSTSG